jgi:tetratricopeptide (TPR) repeat protein
MTGVPSINEALARAAAHQAAGRLAEAEQIYRDLLRGAPDRADVLCKLAKVLHAQGRAKEARRRFRDAIRLRPGDGEAHRGLGDLYRAQALFDQAAASYRQAIEAEPEVAAAHVNLAYCLTQLDRPEEAGEHFRRALALDPGSAEAQLGVANALLQEGQTEQAMTHLHRALALDPGLSVAYMTLAGIPSAGLDAGEIDAIERMLETDELAAADRSNFLFALAKAYEAKGDFPLAFAHAGAAKEIDREGIVYSRAANAEFVERSIATVDADFFRAREDFGSPSKRPVFVVGLPRSGTTLVEQIIASHPDAFGAGELPTLINLAKALPSRFWKPYPDCLAAIDRAAAAALAERHLDHLRTLDAEAARILDKQPFNYRNLGLIALLFPRARIIHCRRDPRDIAVSCHFLKFLKPMPFAYDLADFGHYYREYARLMAHWRRVLPESMLEVDYEVLVSHQEAKSREIIAFCGLDWDEGCLAFHRTGRAVRTASSWQVRQPIYSSSIGRWKRYREFLGPLEETLGDSNS